MTITNHAWVAEHKGATITISVAGIVVDVVDASSDDHPRGAYLVVENEETGERGRSFVTIPLTDTEQAELDRKTADEAAEAAAERAAEAEASMAERDQARAEAAAEAEKRLDDRVDARIRAILDERSVTEDTAR